MKVKTHIEIAEQSLTLLRELAKLGIYGVTGEEVAARFVEKQLEAFVKMPMYTATGKELATITRKES